MPTLVRKRTNNEPGAALNIPNMGGDLSNMKEIQKFNRQAKWAKGFKIATVANVPTTYPLQVGGSPRVLWGIIIFMPVANAVDDDIVTLKVNEDTIIDAVNQKALNGQINQGKQFQYFELPRALSGNDAISLLVDSTGAHDMFITLWLSNEVPGA